MVGWITRPLSDFVDPNRSICYGIVQPGSPVTRGVPIVRVNNFADGGVNASGALRVNAEIEANYRRSRLQGGELLITLVGSMGLSAIAQEELRGWNVARAVGVVPLRSEVDKRWINFAVRSQRSQDFIRMRANTTVQATLNLRDLAELPVPCPPDRVRAEMSAVLSALDDRIALNRRMNETLEAMARAIFKDWFVEFGPTRAKMEGRAPYFASDIWSLFPYRLDDEGKPEGWQRETLGTHISNFDSKRIPVSGGERAKRHGAFPYHGATGVMDHIDDYLFDGVYLLVGEDGSVVKENGLAFTQYVWGKVWVNNHAHVLHGKGAVSTEQVLLYFQHETVTPYITGAVQLKLSQGRMNAMPFIYAGPDVCQAFSSTVYPLFAKYRANVDESKSLAAMCDLLLPKLMSGEVRVKDAEDLVRKAT